MEKQMDENYQVLFWGVLKFLLLQEQDNKMFCQIQQEQSVKQLIEPKWDAFFKIMKKQQKENKLNFGDLCGLIDELKGELESLKKKLSIFVRINVKAAFIKYLSHGMEILELLLLFSLD